MESSPKGIRFYDMDCGVIPTHYKYICILALTTLKMATLVAETYRLSLNSKIKFKQPR